MKEKQYIRSLESRFACRFKDYSSAVEPFFHHLETADIDAVAFRVFRANYFFRISTTPSLIATVALRAVRRRDWPCADSTLAENLHDELGNLAYDPPHLALLSYSFNGLARHCFELAPLEIAAVNFDPRIKPALSEEAQAIDADITDGTRAFRQEMDNLLRRKDDVELLGASYAQETIAEATLTRLHKFFMARAPETASVPPEDAYFLAHLAKPAGPADAKSPAGREAAHAAHAFKNLARLCKRLRCAHALDRALAGADVFLKGQQRLFMATLERMQTAPRG